MSTIVSYPRAFVGSGKQPLATPSNTMSFSQRDINKLFPAVSGECMFCHDYHGETRQFMGHIVHVNCLQHHMHREDWGYTIKRSRRNRHEQAEWSAEGDVPVWDDDLHVQQETI